MNQAETDNLNRARHFEVIAASLDEKLARLEGRDDGAANYARAYLQEHRDQVHARLDTYHTARNVYGEARATHDATQLAFETKRTELLAALEEALAPFALRAFEALQACEDAARRATLEPLGFPAVGSDPANTDAIAQSALGFRKRPLDCGDRCADLADETRGRTGYEISHAIALEDDAIQVAAAIAKRRDKAFSAEDARAAFAYRWRRWSANNQVNAGPERAAAPVSEARETKPDEAKPKQISRVVRPRAVRRV